MSAIAAGCGTESVCPSGSEGDRCRLTADVGEQPDLPSANDLVTSDGLGPDVTPTTDTDDDSEASDGSTEPDETSTDSNSTDPTDDTQDAPGDASDPDADGDGVDDVAGLGATPTNPGEDAEGDDAAADQAPRSIPLPMAGGAPDRHGPVHEGVTRSELT